MQTTNTPLPKSRLQLDFELPPEDLDRAISKAVGRLSRRTRVSGFRPGKAPRPVLERVLGPGAILEEALDQLVDDAFRAAVAEQDIFPLTQPEVEVTQGEEGKPVLFKATVQVRPTVELGDFEHFNFKPEVQPVDETMVEKVVDDLLDGESHLEPVAGRPAQTGDYVVVSVEGSRDGAAFPGGSSDQMPRVLGENRLYPGFDDHIVGLRKGEEREFDLTFPAAFHDEALRGATAHFKLRLKELRARVLPEADDEFARSVGKFESLDELKVELRKRLEANALDRARHDFADKIIDYAVANATSDLPDVLVDQEVEVMHDEWRSALARQGISEDLFFQVRAMNGARGPGSGAAGEPGIAVAGQAASKEGETPSRASLEAELRADFKPGAEQRVKSLLVLSEIARLRGVEVTDLEVEVEVARARTRYADDRGMVQYFESERGRNYIRSTLRRSRAVEQLIDEWLAAHPESPRLRHLEDPNESSPVANPSPGAAEVIAATEPDNLTPQEAAAPAGA